MLQTVTIETRAADADHIGPLRPVGATAALIHRKIAELDGRPLLYVAQTARRAQDLIAILKAYAPTATRPSFRRGTACPATASAPPPPPWAGG